MKSEDCAEGGEGSKGEGWDMQGVGVELATARTSSMLNLPADGTSLKVAQGKAPSGTCGKWNMVSVRRPGLSPLRPGLSPPPLEVAAPSLAAELGSEWPPKPATSQPKLQHSGVIGVL